MLISFIQSSTLFSQLRDSHVRICTELGSDLAYSCYGIFLHAFIAGWEADEKSKSFHAIKGNGQNFLSGFFICIFKTAQTL